MNKNDEIIETTATEIKEATVNKPEPAKPEKTKLKVGREVGRVFAVIFSSLIALIAAVVIFIGIVFGTLGAQFSRNTAEDVVENIDFYGIVTSVGIDNVLSFVSDKLGFEFFGTEDEFDENLKIFLESEEFKQSVVTVMSRAIGALDEDSLNFGFGKNELMDLVHLLAVPIEKYFGYTLGATEYKVIETAVKAAGFTGFALTVPLGEIAAEVAIIRFILSGALATAAAVAVLILFGVIALINLKHPHTAAIAVGVPVILGGLMSAGWAIGETLVLHMLRVKHTFVGTLILAFTNESRNHLAFTGAVLTAIGIVTVVLPFVIGAIKRRKYGTV